MTIEHTEKLTENPEFLEVEDMPNFEHGMICSRLNLHLRNYASANNLGEVLDSSPEYRFLKRPAGGLKRTARFPDLSFVQRERLPRRVRSYPEIVPDLVVEVVSPTDRDTELELKLLEYQQAGVKIVWIIHTISRRIDVYTLANGARPDPHLGDDVLNGGEVIPGFTLKVSTIFDYPADPLDDEDLTPTDN